MREFIVSSANYPTGGIEVMAIEKDDDFDESKVAEYFLPGATDFKREGELEISGDAADAIGSYFSVK